MEICWQFIFNFGDDKRQSVVLQTDEGNCTRGRSVVSCNDPMPFHTKQKARNGLAEKIAVGKHISIEVPGLKRRPGSV